MTKIEVERDIFPTLTIPPDAYFFWWDNIPMMKWEGMEIPVVLGKESMPVEVVDEEDIYKPPADIDTCDCAFCTGELANEMQEILDYIDSD
jgi:hypothetical protein